MVLISYGLQSFSRDSNEKAILVELTIEVNEVTLLIFHQHGGNDVKCTKYIGVNLCLT